MHKVKVKAVSLALHDTRFFVIFVDRHYKISKLPAARQFADVI